MMMNWIEWMKYIESLLFSLDFRSKNSCSRFDYKKGSLTRNSFDLIVL
ncbi:MAG: hypothetical protein Ta2E_12940 [Mycoplasmoidaceae bacterium]|nr:MAG: hypothetical protein Ta2E_12940 [Mycoplasmoidaceae bacterium]